MIVEILLSIIILLLAYMTYGMHVMNNNIHKRNVQSRAEHAEICVEFRKTHVRQDATTALLKAISTRMVGRR